MLLLLQLFSQMWPTSYMSCYCQCSTVAQQHASVSAGGEAEATGAVQPDLASKLSQAGVDKNSALYKAAARIQSRFRGYAVRKVCLVASLYTGHVLA